MFRAIGKSKIAIILAILFGISLFFFRGGSRYSNIFNSDNVVASVSGTSISTTKFTRTLQMNINNFSQMLGRTIAGEEIKAFQIHSLSLGALINDAVFENEFDQKKFKIDQKVIAKKTKERMPQLYDQNNKLNESFLNQLLQQEQLKIEDIVQIIDFETRKKLFDDAFFNINYPKFFAKIISKYDNHLREVKHIKIPLALINIEKIIEKNSENKKDYLEDFYNNNLNQYMSGEKRDVEYIMIDKNNYINNFVPSGFEVSEYYKNNKELYIEKEKRSFIQFNFKNINEANNFKEKIKHFNNFEEIIKYANIDNIKFNTFENLSEDDVMSAIGDVLFKLQINDQSEIIETPFAKHIIILQNIKKESQLKLDEVKNNIINLLTEIEINNYFDNLKNDLAQKIVEGNTLKQIAENFELGDVLIINKLTQNFSNYEENQKNFYTNLITNSFASNKDFVSDIIEINEDIFYAFNVTNIEPSIPLDLNEIKDKVLTDWKTSKKIEKIKKQLEENITNSNFVDELSLLYNIPVKKFNISKESKDLPKKIVLTIFQTDQEQNLLIIENGDIYIAKILNIIITDNDTKLDDLSLSSSLKGSFGAELLNNVKISTNDSLINAVVNRY